MAFPGSRIGYRDNLALAKRLWSGQINREQQHSLKSLSENYGFSVAAGDLQLLENRWYVTHSGRDQVDEKALLNLRGVIRTSFVNLNGH